MECRLSHCIPADFPRFGETIWRHSLSRLQGRRKRASRSPQIRQRSSEQRGPRHYRGEDLTLCRGIDRPSNAEMTLPLEKCRAIAVLIFLTPARTVGRTAFDA